MAAIKRSALGRGLDALITMEDKKTGYLINYNTEEIYASMKEFLTNKNLISEIRKNILTIENQFDSKKIFDEVEEILLNLKNSQNH